MTPRLVTGEHDIAGVLREAAVFAGAGDEELAAIAAEADALAFADGEPIVREGSEARAFFLIVEGRARVLRAGDAVAVLGPGDSFGEIALLEHSGRTASVVAEGDVVAIGLLAAPFKAMLARHPRIAMRILEQERARIDGGDA